MRRKLTAGVALFMALTLSLSFLSSAGASSFDPGRIIDDAIFDNTGTMNAAQIDAWLNATFGSTSCISTDHGFSAPDPTGYNPTNGFLYGGNVSAGRVIYDASQAYGLNPQVLLATLEKEQSLVSGGAGCTTLRYTGATGYGCPDGGTQYSYSGVDLYSINGVAVTSISGTCVNTAAKAGFSQQVIHAAWLLKFGEERSEGNINWDVQLTNSPEAGDRWDNSDDPQSCYSGPMTAGTYHICPGDTATAYDGDTTIDGTSVQITNGATAALYWYTPHFAGNENFSTIFNEWFGPPTNDADLWELVQDSSSGKIYLVSGRTADWVPGPAYLDAWGLENFATTEVSSSYITNLTQGPNLTYVGLDINGARYLMSNGEKYLLTSDNDVLDWGVAGIAHISAPGYVAQMPSGGNAGRFATDATSGITYLLDGTEKHAGLSAQSLSYWGQNSSDTTTVTSDILAGITTGPAVDRYVTVGGKDMLIDQATALTFKNAAVESAWGTHAYVGINAYATNMIAQVAATDFMLDTANGRWYYIEGGNEHYISNTSLATVWGWSASNPLTSVSDALASQFSVGPNLSYLAASATTNDVYVIDGSKHLIANNTYLPLWEGSQTPLSVSDNALSLLPTGANIQTMNVGFTNYNKIFTLDNGQLRYIPSPTVLAALGGSNNNPVITLNLTLEGLMPQNTSALDLVAKDSGGTTYYLENGSYYIINPDSLNTWSATAAPTVSADFLAALTNTNKTVGYAVTIGGHKYLVNGRTLLDVTTDYDNYGLTSADFVAITKQYFPTQQTSTYLVGTPGSNEIWLLGEGNRYYIPTPDLLYDLGYGRISGVVSLNQDIVANLPVQSATATQLVKAPSGGVIFASLGSGYGFRDSATLSDYTQGRTIMTISASDFSRFPFVGWAAQLVTGSDGKIYAVSGGQKHWVTGPSILSEHYAGQTVLGLPQSTIDDIPTGTAITS